MVRREVRFPGFCRESMVKKLFGLVVEYPSDCSAAPRTTLCLNSFCLNTLRLTTSAEQGFSFPIPVQATVTRMKGLQDCVRRDFNACSLNLSMEHGIEQFAEADLQGLSCFLQTYGLWYGEKGFRWSKKLCQLTQAA